MALSLLGCDLPGVGVDESIEIVMAGGFRIVIDGTFCDGVSIKDATDIVNV